MALTAANGTSASMWAGRRDDPTAANWGGSREPDSAFRGTATRGRARGGGRTRAGGRGGRPPSDRTGVEAGGESLRPSNATGKLTTSSNNRTRQSGNSTSPEKTPSTRINSSALGSRKGDAGDKSSRSETNGLKDLPSQGGPQRSATLKASATSLQSTPSTTSASSSKASSRRRRSAGSRKSSISVKNPKQLSSTSLAPPVPSFPNSATRVQHLPSASLEPISPMHDIRQDVDSLVDHVRTMAMEGNRASSPATHIDWAGDDDDSLPDLEDWGISSNKIIDDDRLASTVDDHATAAPAKSSSDVDKAGEVTLSSSVGSMAGTIKTQDSISSPTESNDQTEAVPPINTSPRARGDRKRDRGRGKDKEKKTTQSTLLPSSTSSKLSSSISTPKKSLLERLSPPTHPDPISVPKRSEKSPLRTINGIGESRSPVSTLPYHPSLPPKPISSPFTEGSPRRSNGSNFTSKPSSPWNQRHEEVKVNVQSVDADGTELSMKTQPVAQETPDATKLATTEEVTNEEPKWIENKKKEDLALTEVKAPSLDTMKDATFLTSTSFDWSDEPTPFDPIFPQPSVKLDIEPPTPLEELPSSRANTNMVSSGFPNTRSRAQRPLSGDITPRVRRERSPHKSHNARNHSAPSPGGMGAARTRTPHATRPIIRMDALAMISRSLRESPTPSRRESPAPTAISAAE